MKIGMDGKIQKELKTDDKEHKHVDDIQAIYFK